MRLEQIILKNFRSYAGETRIDLEDLTVFVGRNDVGKSTILEALEVFFNNKLVKIESHDSSINSDSQIVEIGCVFGDLEDIVIDATALTSLKDEFLLNSDGRLEIRKRYNCGAAKITPSILAVAQLPAADELRDLLYLKNADLKRRFDDLQIQDETVNRASNVSLRQSIYAHRQPADLIETYVDLNKEDAKKIWEQLKNSLPLFALFKSDRPSTDEDTEVQDPMKLAIAEVVGRLGPELDEIKERVAAEVTTVAERTIEKLQEMAPDLASELRPTFRAEPNWATLFKISLTDDQQVPVNKRGSGVRRLILLNFFRAEAERRQEEQHAPGVIYGIEEPETSQHPDNQSMLIKALHELSNAPSAQVLLTTHVPALAGLVPVESIRYICRTADGVQDIRSGAVDDDKDELFQEVSESLGVLPETSVRILLCVEGPNDVAFLKSVSKLLHDQDDATIVDLSSNESVAFLPLGGSTLKQWVEQRHLRSLNKQEVHIYDLDDADDPPYQEEVDKVNGWGNDSWATLTSKRTMENYLHPDAIQEVFGFAVAFGPMDDVPELVARRVHEASEATTLWDDVEEDKRKAKIRKAKRRLNHEVAGRMNIAMLQESDPNGDIKGWLAEIRARI